MQAHVVDNSQADNAIRDYAASLHREGYDLVAYNVYGADLKAPADCLFSNLPEPLHNEMVGHSGDQHCPFIMQALTNGDAFGKRSAVRERYSDTFTEEQLQIMESFEYEQIGVVARKFGDKIHLSIFGFKEQMSDAEARDLLCAAHSSFSEDLCGSYAGADRKNEDANHRVKTLSKVEKRYIQELMSGRGNTEIAKSLGLGEITIRLVEKSVCKKLNANNSREVIRQFAEMKLVKAN